MALALVVDCSVEKKRGRWGRRRRRRRRWLFRKQNDGEDVDDDVGGDGIEYLFTPFIFFREKLKVRATNLNRFVIDGPANNRFDKVGIAKWLPNEL